MRRKYVLVAWRYLDICIISLTAIIVLPLISGALVPIGYWLGNHWRLGGLAGLAGAASLLLAITMGPIYHVATLDLFCLRSLQTWCNWFRYPPYWLAIAVAGVILFVTGYPSSIIVENHNVAAEDWRVLCVCVAVGIASANIIGWMQHRVRNPGSIDNGRSSKADAHSIHAAPRSILAELLNDSRLIDWIRSEVPIDRLDQDWFGFRERAGVLADALLEHPGDTFGVVGSFGTGKTSLLHMADKCIDSLANKQRWSRRLIRVYIGQWGQQDEAAAEYTLTCAISALSRHVDCLAITTLPLRYVQAVTQAKPPWWISWLLWKRPDAIEQLQELNLIVETIDAHLVLYLEDVDRNASNDSLQERYIQFQAMLDRLHDKRCDRLTFVLTASSTAIDFSRLCDHRFTIPKLGFMYVGAVVQAFRVIALRSAVEKYGDIFPHMSLDDINVLAQKLPDFRLRLWMPTEEGPVDHSLPWKEICELLSRPRRLKAALNATWRAWGVLHGEVDFDDLFLIQVIRVVSPRAFDVLHDLWTLEKAELVWSGTSAEKQKAHAEEMRRIWQQRVSDCTDDERDKIVRLSQRVLNIPPEEGHSMIMGVHYLSEDSPQSPRSDVDAYWERIWEERVDTSQRVRDQKVLQALSGWRVQPLQLIQSIEDQPCFVDIFEHFVKNNRLLTAGLRINYNELLSIAVRHFRFLLDRFGADASESLSNGFVPIWRLTDGKRRNRSEEYYQWVKTEVLDSITESLRLAMDIEYYWGSDRVGYLPTEYRRQLQRDIMIAVRDRWISDPTAFGKVLSVRSQRHVWAINHLVVHAYDAESNELTPEDWIWLIDIFRAAFALQPGLSIPHFYAMLGTDAQIRETDEDGELQASVEFRINRRFATRLMPDTVVRQDVIRAALDAHDQVPDGYWSAEISSWLDRIRPVFEDYLAEGTPDASADQQS